MKGYHISLSIGLVLAFAVLGCSPIDWKPNDLTPNRWSDKEMSSRRGSFMEADLKPGSPFCGLGFARCTFDLYYFEGPPVIKKDTTKYILYIPGGPGDIVDRSKPMLDIFDLGARYIYFDVRGTGYSLIPESNEYDEFLRARYVVEDIEALRRKIFNECAAGEVPIEHSCEMKTPRPWDAIYAHSWGTIVAQMYAAKYGKKHVTKLILSAPVSRAYADTGADRQTMIVKNLLDIYKKHSNIGCPWDDDPSPDLEAFLDGGTMGRPSERSLETFCFLGEQELSYIEKELRALLNHLERDYGSVAFVGRFYDKLIKDAEFRNNYPYPAEFFRALRWLEWYGAGEKPGFRFEQSTRKKKMDAAFFIGYYLMTQPKPSPIDANGKKSLFECKVASPFLRSIDKWPGIQIPGFLTIDRKVFFCDRLYAAEEALDGEAPNDVSLRASVVFGLYDGITRWIFRLLEDQDRTKNGCFTGRALQDIRSGVLLPDKKIIIDITKQLGILASAEVCPWDPMDYRHQVDTLILSGGSDPVTAGGQAMDFYRRGLTPGKRALIEFHSVGHLMSQQLEVGSEKNVDENGLNEKVPLDIAKKFGGMLSRFLNSKIDEFVNDDKGKDQLDKLGGCFLGLEVKTLPISAKPSCTHNE
jgi:pimeloyl-ACP methyl ester carboxylesterase